MTLTMHVSPHSYCECVCCTHSLVEMAFACGGLKPGVCWAMAGRDDSSLSEVSVNKTSVFTPTTREPSSSSRPGVLSWAEGRKVWRSGCTKTEESKLYAKCIYKNTYCVSWRQLVYNYGGLKKIQNDSKWIKMLVNNLSNGNLTSIWLVCHICYLLAPTYTGWNI